MHDKIFKLFIVKNDENNLLFINLYYNIKGLWMLKGTIKAENEEYSN